MPQTHTQKEKAELKYELFLIKNFKIEYTRKYVYNSFFDSV